MPEKDKKYEIPAHIDSTKPMILNNNEQRLLAEIADSLERIEQKLDGKEEKEQKEGIVELIEDKKTTSQQTTAKKGKKRGATKSK